MTKRTVKVMQGERIVYDGPEQRSTIYESAGRLFWGLTIADFLKMVGIVVGITITYQNIKADLKSVKDNQLLLSQNQAALSQQMKSYQECQENADGWHSAITGTQFRCGAPINTAYNTQAVRKGFKSFIDEAQKPESN